MLSELAEYAYSHGLSATAGFKPKNVKGYICLSKNGKFLDVVPREKGAPQVYAPDIGSAANGTRYCNPLIEKAKIILCMVEDAVKDKNIPTKHDFFLSMLDDAAAYEPCFRVIAKVLRSEKAKDEIIAALKKSKLKGGDAVGFMVDGIPAEKYSGVTAWWSEFRKLFASAPSGEFPRCFITGELAPSIETVPKVSGLRNVGGHTAGDAFLCYDKDAFQSYGLKKSANASVSEEGMTAVNAALTDLFAKAPILGGAKIVHWYAGSVPEEFDIFNNMLDGIWDGSEDEESDEIEEEADETSSQDEERSALLASKQLISSIRSGERPLELSARYYIMPVSGVNGRMMVRGWDEGSFEKLYTNIDQWFSDLMLVSAKGNGWTKPPKLKSLCIRLLKAGGDSKRAFDRVDSELSNLTGLLLDAIINGNPLPDEVGSRALRYIRSEMLLANQDDRKTNPIRTETMAFQLLKAWLIRLQRQRGDENVMGTDINTSPRTVAYCCGQLMAVYSAIQSKAMPEVNVSIAERYYAAASTSPAFVIGKLAQLSQHHLSKLDDGLAIYYQRMLSEIYMQIGERSIPTTMNQEQQTEFALGYYQQQVAIYTRNAKD